jgi:hypothetical protein
VYHSSSKRVARLLSEVHLGCVHKKKNRRTTNSHHHESLAENRLERYLFHQHQGKRWWDDRFPMLSSSFILEKLYYVPDTMARAFSNPGSIPLEYSK